MSLEQIGPESPETVAARELVARRTVRIARDETRLDSLWILEGESGGRAVSLLLDADGRMLRGVHVLAPFHRRVRRGPCRHLQSAATCASGREVIQPRNVVPSFLHQRGGDGLVPTGDALLSEWPERAPRGSGGIGAAVLRC